jgi:hypothetical protein
VCGHRIAQFSEQLNDSPCTEKLSVDMLTLADYNNSDARWSRGGYMLRRLHVLPLLVCVVTCLAIAGPKKKNLLPSSVLSAHTVLVLIDPQAGTSSDAPLANKTAQEDVEKALMKWGRLTPVMETQTADLLIIAAKAHGNWSSLLSAVYLRIVVLSLRKRATPTSASVRSKVTLFLKTAQLAGQTLRSRKKLSPTRKRMSARPTTRLSSIKAMWTVP